LTINALTSYSQVQLGEGAFMRVKSNTDLSLLSNNGILALNDSSQIENNGRILFYNNSKLSETSLLPIYGQGHEISFQDTAFLGWNEPGQFGFAFNTSMNLNAFNLYRFHKDTLSEIIPETSINRYFKIYPSFNNFNGEISFRYDSSELNGLGGEHPVIIRITNELKNLGGALDNDSLKVKANSDTLNVFALTYIEFKLDTINPSAICLPDTLFYEFSTNDLLYNDGNEYILGFITTIGDTIYLDSTSNSGTHFVIIDDSIATGLSTVFIHSTLPIISDTSIYQIEIFPIPQITISNPISMCLNEDSLLLQIATPNGGTYLGNGVVSNYFYPNLTGDGTFNVIYQFTDLNSCSNSDTTQITVNPIPLVPTITNSNDTLFSNLGDSYQWYLDGNVISGATGQFLVPLVEGEYVLQIFNSYGCSEFSGPFNFISNSIKDIQFSNISIYPNPASESFKISFNSNQQAVLKIFDLTGKHLFSYNIKSNDKIDLINIHTGLYPCILQTENETFSFKLIIQK